MNSHIMTAPCPSSECPGNDLCPNGDKCLKIIRLNEKRAEKNSANMDEIRFYRAAGEYGFLSNLYRHAFEFEGRLWRCAEDAYQFGKPKDQAVAEWIISAPKPHLCAAAAHALLSFDITPDWQKKKVVRMAQVIDAKFRSEVLSEKLLLTWPCQLTEESNTDSFWGIGKKGTGRNMLGILLMATREQIHAQNEGDL